MRAAVSDAPSHTRQVAGAARRRTPAVVVFEPHPPAHAHHRYASALVEALKAAPESPCRFQALWGKSGDAGTIQVPRALSDYKRRAFGVIDRAIHWRRSDRQIVEWVAKHDDIQGVHYLHAYGLPTALAVRWLRSRNKKTVLTIHNVRPHSLKPYDISWARDFIDRQVYRSFDALIVHSTSLRETLIRLLGRNHPKILVIPHGVDSLPGARDIDDLPKRLALRKLLFIGAPRPNKGLLDLVNAMTELPGFSLTLAGYHSVDRYRQEVLDPAIAKARSRGCVIEAHAGYISEEHMGQLLRTHSCVVLPYRDFAAQSGVLNLACAYRVPAVVTDVGAMGETVRSHGCGTVIASAAPDVIADGVRRLYAIPANDLQSALEATAAACSWEKVASAILEAWRDILPVRESSR